MEYILFGFSLMLAFAAYLGIQSFYILKNGNNPRKVIIICIVSAMCDLLLVGISIMISEVIASIALLKRTFKLGGVVFLLVYGIKSLLDAFKTKAANVGEKASNKIAITKRLSSNTIIIALFLVFFNPAVYVDMIIIAGMVAGIAPSGRFLFFIGAGIGSITWFSFIGATSIILGPILKKQVAMRILNAISSIVMFVLAFVIIISEIGIAI